jgi:predicted nucleic acid-binding protein
MPKSPRIFLDTSVIIAAVMSPTGGARLLFHLAQAGALALVAGTGVLQETEAVLLRKAPQLLPLLAQLLDEIHLEIGGEPAVSENQQARSLIDYLPDAHVLAQAIHAEPDWFASHDKAHFLENPALKNLPFKIGSPGDVFAWLRDSLES